MNEILIRCLACDSFVSKKTGKTFYRIAYQYGNLFFDGLISDRKYDPGDSIKCRLVKKVLKDEQGRFISLPTLAIDNLSAARDFVEGMNSK